MLPVIAMRSLKSTPLSPDVTASDRLAVRAHEIAEPVRDRAAASPRALQPCISSLVPSVPAANITPRAVSERRRSTHAPVRSLVTRYPSEPSLAPERRDVDHLALGDDPHAPPLGQIEVVLHQRVLRVVAAADHAATASHAPAARRPLAAEVRVRRRLARLAEEHADVDLGVRVLHAHVDGHMRRAGRRPDRRRSRAPPRASARPCRSAARARSPSPPAPPTGGSSKKRLGAR